MARIAIVIIAYNEARFTPVQLELIRKYCTEPQYDVHVIDNSTNDKTASEIEYHTRLRNIPRRPHNYFRTRANAINSSVSAVFALNVSYTRLRDDYDYFFYLDHDAFPVRQFSIVDEIGDKVMAGVGQQKSKMYMHTGYLMFNNSVIPHTLIDFSCNNEFGLDTGGNLYKVVDKYPDGIKYWNEEYEENPYFNKGFYNFYSMINDRMFMHFINGSGWNALEKHLQDERINSLLNVLHDKTNKQE